MKKIIVFMTLSIIALLTLTSTVLAAPWDIQGHWAEDYIITLLNQNIMQTYDDGQFKPNQAITRAEFAQSLANSLYLDEVGETELTDIQNHPAKGAIAALVNEGIVTGFPDKTFRPEEKLTRAQVVTMLTRALGLDESKAQINLHSSPSYLDIKDDHWAQYYIKLATELDILNGYPDGTFRAKELTTRAQAAKMIQLFRDYKPTEGFIADVYPASNKISITNMVGERLVLSISDTALIGRNNRLVSITDFLKTDKIYILTDETNQARYIKAYGIITKADLTEQVSQMTNYILDPYEVEALARGDYQLLKPKLLNEVQVRLMDFGMKPAEVEALLNSEWDTLENHGKVRLGEAIAVETGLPLDMVQAVMAQDWEKVKSLAQVEAVQWALRELMYSDFLS